MTTLFNSGFLTLVNIVTCSPRGIKRSFIERSDFSYYIYRCMGYG